MRAARRAVLALAVVGCAAGGTSDAPGGSSGAPAGSATPSAVPSAEPPPGACQPGAERDCYPGDPSEIGKGPCTSGVERCAADGAWGGCEGAVVPTEEVCDGVDNDCNGQVDDGVKKPEIPNGVDDDCDHVVDEGPDCTGQGLIAVIDDPCIADGGTSDKDDALEIYCVNGSARFCLSKEACPWRDGQPTSDAVSCSTSGLASSWMATVLEGCAGWQGHEQFCCSADGKISFAGC
jgi:hypothetical protein